MVFLVMFVYAEEVFLVATGSDFSVLLRLHKLLWHVFPRLSGIECHVQVVRVFFGVWTDCGVVIFRVITVLLPLDHILCEYVSTASLHCVTYGTNLQSADHALDQDGRTLLHPPRRNPRLHRRVSFWSANSSGQKTHPQE
jgi:hypothetical protein